jgi:hypothetical protein
MTSPVSANRPVGGVSMGESRRASGVRASAPAVELPVIEGAAGESEVRSALAAARGRCGGLAAALEDPETMLMALAGILESAESQCNGARVELNRTEREANAKKQLEAIRRASEEAKTAEFWGTFAKIAGYVGAIAGVVASIASCVVTGPGGVLGAAAIIGACAGGLGLVGTSAMDIARAVGANGPAADLANGSLSVTVGVRGMVASILGVIANPLNALSVAGNLTSMLSQAATTTCSALSMAGVEIVPNWLPMLFAGVGLVGGSLSAGGAATGARAGGEAAAAASGTARRVAQTVQTVASGVRGASQIVDGGASIGSAVANHSAEQERITAQRAGHAMKQLSAAMAALVEELREIAESYGRQRSRAIDMGQSRAQSRASITHNMVRA